MNELQKAQADYEAAYYKERNSAGVDPTVCIAGKHDYITFKQAILNNFGIILSATEQAESHCKTLKFNGVTIHQASSFERGFVFGGDET